MIYAQFYHQSATDKSKLIEGSGDRAVFILDGRNGALIHDADARAEAVKRGYLGYRIMSGETFTRSHPKAPPVSLPVMYVMGYDPTNNGRLLAMSNIAYTRRADAEHMRDGCASAYRAFIFDGPPLAFAD